MRRIGRSLKRLSRSRRKRSSAERASVRAVFDRKLLVELLESRHVLSVSIVQFSADQPTQTTGSVGQVTFTADVDADESYDAQWQITEQATGYQIASGDGTVFSFTPGEQPDNYLASITATDTDGNTVWATTTTTVVDAAPIVSLAIDQPTQTAGSVGQVNFVASVTADADYDTDWDIVDEATGREIASGSGDDYSFTPPEYPDTYQTNLSVTDIYGQSVFTSGTFSVVDPAPVVSLTADRPTQVAGSVEQVNFTGTVTAANPYDSQWSILDQTANVIVASGDGDDFSFKPGQTPDTYVATLTSTDAFGEAASSTLDFAVSAIPPSDVEIAGLTTVLSTLPVSLTVSYTAGTDTADDQVSWSVFDSQENLFTSGSGEAIQFTAGDPDTYTIVAEVDDPDYGTSATGQLTLHVLPLDDTLTADNPTYTVGEDASVAGAATGTSSAGLSVWLDNWPYGNTFPTTNGTVAADGAGGFTYTPASGFVGTDSFSYTVDDGANTAGGTVTFNVAPDVLTPNSTTFTLNQGGSASGAVGGTSSSGLGVGVDNWPYSGGFSTASGSVSTDAYGDFVYSPNPGFYGTDVFGYTVDDGANTADGTMTFVVNPDVLTTTNPSFSLDDDDTVSGTIGATSTSGFTIVFDNWPYSGGFGTTSGWVTTDGSGDFTYTPNADFVGTDGFTYTADDGANTTTGTVTFTVNAAPQDVLTADSTTYTLVQGASASGTASGTSSFGLDVWLDNWPASGFTTANGNVATDGSGDFTYTPNSDFTGTDSFDFTVDDGLNQTTGTMTFVVNPPPPPDVLTATSVVYTLGQYSTVAGVATGTSSLGLTVGLDNWPYHYGFSTTDGSVSTDGSGGFIYTPNAGFIGTDSFDFTVDDGQSTADGTITLVVNAVDDTLTATSAGYTLDENTSTTGTITGTSTAGLPVTIDPSLASGTFPTAYGGSIAIDSSGNFTYTPASGYSGSDSFNFTVHDAAGTATGTLTFTVNNTDPPPPPPDQLTADSLALTVDQGSDVTGVATGTSTAALSIGLDNWPYSSNFPTTSGIVYTGPDGSFDYVPNPGFSGTDSFDFTVDDGQNTATGTVTITVVPDVLAPGSATYDLSQGNSVYAVIGAASSFGLNVNVDWTPDSTFYTAYGSVATGEVGAFTYTPNAGFYGTDSFDFTVDDGLNSTTGTITFDVAPELSAYSQSFDVYPDEGASGTVGGASAWGLPVELASWPFNGAFSTSYGSVSTDGSGGFIYTPNAGYYGADSFDYTIGDGEDSATGTMTFNVSPVPPTNASFSGSTSLVQGDTASLSLSYVPGTETDDDVSWTVTNPAGVIVASGSDTQISFNADTVGAYYVSATVTDPLYPEASTSASAQINVTAPVPPTNVRFGGTTSAYIGDTLTLGVSYTAGSSTNDNVTWTVDDSAGNLIASGSGTSVRFPAIAAGSYTVDATVSDSHYGLAVSGTTTVSVTPPVAPGDVAITGSTAVHVGDNVQLSIGYTPGSNANDDVTWDVLDPSGSEVASGTGTTIAFATASAGDYTVEAEVDDATYGLSAAASTTVVATAPTPPGNVGISGSMTATAGTQVSLTIDYVAGTSTSDSVAWVVKNASGTQVAAGTGTTVTFTAGTAGPYTVSATIDDTTYNLSANGGASISVPQGATINAPNFTALSSLDAISFTGSSAISISDPGAVDVVMSLLVSDGALSVSSNPSVAQSTTPEGTGMVLNLFGTPAAIDNVLSSLAFNSSDGMQATLTLEVSDSVNAPALTFATLGSLADPVVSAPRSVSFTSAAPHVFTSANAIAVSDPNVNSILVSLEVAAGTLSLSGSVPSGVSYTGSGSEISLSGSISGVNTALGLLVCTDAAGGSTTLLIEPSDQGAYEGAVHESLAAVALYIQTTGGGGSPIVGPSNVEISGTTSVTAGSAVALAVSYTPGTSTVDTVSWNVTSNGAQVAAGTGSQIHFTAGAAGASYIVSATVSDTNGLSASATAQVNVAQPGQPVGPSGVTFTGNTNINPGDTASLTVGYTAGSDPNDTVSWTVTGVDGTQIASGSGTSITFTDDGDGPYDVSATVSDRNGSADGDTTVNVNSNGPVLGPALTYTVLHDQELDVDSSDGVLGDNTSGIEVWPNDDLSGAPETSSNGSYEVFSDGSFVYDPGAGFVGTDSFTYQTADSAGNVGAGVVTISVTDQAPVVRATSVNTLPGQAVQITSGYGLDESDDDNDPLTNELVDSSGDNLGAEAPTAHGTVVLNGDGSFEYFPQPDSAGEDSFEYRAFDGALYSNPATVTISMDDPAPVGLAGLYFVQEGEPFISSGSLFADPSVLGNGVLPDDQLALLSNVQYGSLSIATDGSFTYTPEANYTGTDSFTYSLTDAFGTTATVTLSFLVQSAPIYPSFGTDVTAYQDAAGSTVTADGVHVLGLLTDAEIAAGDSVVQSSGLFSIGGQPADVGTLDLARDGTFTYAAAADEAGQCECQYAMLDAEGDEVGSGVLVIDIQVPSLYSVSFSRFDGQTYAQNPVIVKDPTGQNRTSDLRYKNQWPGLTPNPSSASMGDPLTYAAGDTIAAAPAISLPAYLSIPSTQTVYVVGIIPGTQGDPWATAVFRGAMASNGHGTWTAQPLNSLQSLVPKAGISTLTIQWEVSFDGKQHWGWIGKTQDKIYVTAAHMNPALSTTGAPGPVPSVYESVLYIGCQGVSGLAARTDQQTVINEVWQMFANNDDLNHSNSFAEGQLKRVDGTVLTYYANYACKTTDTRGLLLTSDGGCNAFTNLLLNTFWAQGVSGGGLVAVHSNLASRTITVGFLYGPWRYTGPAIQTNVDGFPYSNVSARNLLGVGQYNWLAADATDLRTIIGQGGTHPASMFEFHAVVSINGTIYDPSYGTSATNINAYLTSANALVGGWFFRLPMTDILYIGRTAPKPGTQLIASPPIPYPVKNIY